MTDGDRVVLTVPSRGEFARTVRLAAAELATRAEMDIDTVDDVRLAVDEAFVFAGEHAAGPEIAFTFSLAPGWIQIVVGPLTADAVNEEAPDQGERYARFILQSICDEFEILETDGAHVMRLVRSTAV
jgi:anti-sigma regulatory factor (Ser/Thr protein kinase)